MNYLAQQENGQLYILAGPLSVQEIVALVDLQDNSRENHYGNASRHSLISAGYTRSKKGERMLLDAIRNNKGRLAAIRGLSQEIDVNGFATYEKTVVFRPGEEGGLITETIRTRFDR